MAISKLPNALKIGLMWLIHLLSELLCPCLCMCVRVCVHIVGLYFGVGVLSELA